MKTELMNWSVMQDVHDLGEKLGISAAAVGQFEKKNSNPI